MFPLVRDPESRRVQECIIDLRLPEFLLYLEEFASFFLHCSREIGIHADCHSLKLDLLFVPGIPEGRISVFIIQ